MTKHQILCPEDLFQETFATSCNVSTRKLFEHPFTRCGHQTSPCVSCCYRNNNIIDKCNNINLWMNLVPVSCMVLYVALKLYWAGLCSKTRQYIVEQSFQPKPAFKVQLKAELFSGNEEDLTLALGRMQTRPSQNKPTFPPQKSRRPVDLGRRVHFPTKTSQYISTVALSWVSGNCG